MLGQHCPNVGWRLAQHWLDIGPMSAHRWADVGDVGPPDKSMLGRHCTADVGPTLAATSAQRRPDYIMLSGSMLISQPPDIEWNIGSTRTFPTIPARASSQFFHRSCPNQFDAIQTSYIKATVSFLNIECESDKVILVFSFLWMVKS